jgi:hypothetical protein
MATALGPSALGPADPALPAEQRPRDLLHNVVLDDEQVAFVALVPLRPEVSAGLRIDQLGGHPHPTAGGLDTAFEQIPDAKFTADLPRIDMAIPKREARRASDHREITMAGQIGDGVLADAVGQAVPPLVTGEIGEWQDGNGGAPAGFGLRRRALRLG